MHSSVQTNQAIETREQTNQAIETTEDSGPLAPDYPGCVIIGFKKCGTRALLYYLARHPYIKSAGTEKHFYDVDEHFAKGYDWYLSQFPNKTK